MKFATSLLLICCWVNSLAQTNSAPAAPESLSPSSPEPQWQTPPTKPVTPDPSISTNSLQGLNLETPLPKGEKSPFEDYAALSADDAHPPTILNSEQALMLRYHERLKDSGYLTPASLASEDLFSRTVNAMFRPEPVRVGKTSVAFSPVTAIKRKNPLALFNPVVFNISW